MKGDIKDQASILKKLGIEKLNEMQEEALQSIPKYSEIVLLSPTGSGKTLAFLLPLIDGLDPKQDQIQALIIAPSRELVLQIEQVAREMGSGYKTNAIYGGRSSYQDRIDLQHPPAILVGTPGRIADHLRKETFSTEQISTLILDEFDKSLEGIEGSQSDGGNSVRIFQSWMTYQEDRISDTFWIATCNKLDTILSWSGGALAARFDCIFFVDMPTPEECKGIAKIWSEKKDVQIPEDYDFEGFSGRDIKKLARQMAMLDASVDEARRYIIPVQESDPDLIKNIRTKARKTCIWASKEQETMSVKRRIKI